MNIQKFINNNSSGEKIFHSNAYARVASGSSIGSVANESFGQRLHTHRNRQTVRRYGDSLIGRGDANSAPHVARQSVAPRRSNVPQPQRGNATPKIRPSFNEPSTRGYNPYG